MSLIVPTDSPAGQAPKPRPVVELPTDRMERRARRKGAVLVAGVDEVYRVCGAQAVAMLAYGTKTVRAVDKIVGSGNAF